MDFEVYDIALIPIVIALVRLAGSMGVPSRLLPAVALALGLVGGFVYLAPDDPKRAALVGVVLGLSAIGAHSGIKNTIERKVKEELREIVPKQVEREVREAVEAERLAQPAEPAADEVSAKPAEDPANIGSRHSR
ncbi:hypothetical protein [Paenibacillus sp.]|uniref:hypothetical protein n=1 Tax=Paenibacillus sp. TaxID=58172 RepID=UPI002D61568D|nr:hypothetical protein [Paenibacillus sp.]HZG55311.1 hypothetical protein [Paenibacillus sp.]